MQKLSHVPRRHMILLLLGFLVAVAAPAAIAAPPPDAGHSGCVTTPAALELRSPYLGPAEEEALAQSPRGQEQPYTYLLHVPERLPHRPVPLLVAMHGLGGSGSQFAAQSEWARFADKHSFIAAFPTGPRKWDFRDSSTDVDFLRAVVDEIRNEQCVDGRRIWAAGHSMGGFMTQRLACDAGDLFAAGASTAGGNVTAPVIGGDCSAGADATEDSGYEPVALGFWHGTDDQVVRYDGGRTTLAGWVERYQCRPIALDEGAPYGPVEVFGDCARADIAAHEAATERPFQLRFHTYNDHLHGYPDGCGGLGALSRDPCELDASAWPTVETHNTEILEFLAAHPRHRPAGG